MAQTEEGALKLSARKAGVGLEELRAKVAAGEKWCYRCRTFKRRAAFNADASRFDGRAAVCRMCTRRLYKRLYVPKIGGVRRFGPLPHKPRDGDKKQARQRINVLVRSGRIPHPNSLPCFDCKHEWKNGERRHEYDHYLGYGAANHYDVQAVCTICHYRRAKERGEIVARKRSEEGIFLKKGG